MRPWALVPEGVFEGSSKWHVYGFALEGCLGNMFKVLGQANATSGDNLRPCHTLKPHEAPFGSGLSGVQFAGWLPWIGVPRSCVPEGR